MTYFSKTTNCKKTFKTAEQFLRNKVWGKLVPINESVSIDAITGIYTMKIYLHSIVRGRNSVKLIIKLNKGQELGQMDKVYEYYNLAQKPFLSMIKNIRRELLQAVN